MAGNVNVFLHKRKGFYFYLSVFPENPYSLDTLGRFELLVFMLVLLTNLSFRLDL